MTDTPTAVLPRAFGSVSYWMARCAGAPVAVDALFDKRRKELHRYEIADVNGRLALTIPIVRPHNQMARWSDVRISDHGEWWHRHRIALESAYGRTPYFEFYIDRFAPFFSADTPGRFASLLHYNRASEALIASLLLTDSADTAVVGTQPLSPGGQPLSPLSTYWQPRAAQLGFISDLSVLDLLFCLGPEAALYMRGKLITSTSR